MKSTYERKTCSVFPLFLLIDMKSYKIKIPVNNIHSRDLLEKKHNGTCIHKDLLALT
ncbi:unnamed protein product [Schistosoma rodhaini]|uniref:Uncharacterized protein n=1 Tax=Schistosoma rodhaini TaxID=6188 RepID=A0AA85EII0_9TREM|nr:unnamed protein product [Schistosoma rodhaini]